MITAICSAVAAVAGLVGTIIVVRRRNKKARELAKPIEDTAKAAAEIAKAAKGKK